MIKCKNACPMEQFDGCCALCPQKESCEEACTYSPGSCGVSIMEGDEGSALAVFEKTEIQTLKKITDVLQQKKLLEEREKQLKAYLYELMQTYGIKKFDSPALTMTLVAPTTATTVDSAKLKKIHPEIYQECSKVSQKSGYVRVALKDKKGG